MLAMPPELEDKYNTTNNWNNAVTTLNAGTKSYLVRLWNVHQDLDRVASISRVELDLVETFLKSRPGYPDIINGRPRDVPFEERPRVKVTLPRLKFLEGA